MKVKIIVLIIISILILGFIFWPKPVSCTADCNTICDLEEKCCYNGCVSGGCSGNGKDVNYYKDKGYITPGGNPGAQAYLVGEQTDWVACEDNLP
jgi:hypothetical protein